MARLPILRRGGDGLETSSIVFFGHSLSRADYSYFESIFSTVDLYNGHTAWFSYTQTTPRVFASQRWPRYSPSLIIMAVRLVLPGIAITSHTSSCSKADLSFGRFRSICSKGCFPSGPLSCLCLRVFGFVTLSGSVGKIENRRAQPDLNQHNCRSRKG